ncbi:hypothetical protein KVR01_001622 [Diaporthe batatas]|uniref:uncharacterized protein n=1 Tax=Diaporthe batatas TaxID=748121 RepID=UPI001D041C71|nr:uncharacterized protein KVR01_001622 [Diaporthe batatas]KAG8168873.1 hypothetical protein KVR01_001622 [Diaporthe batatas]
MTRYYRIATLSDGTKILIDCCDLQPFPPCGPGPGGAVAAVSTETWLPEYCVLSHKPNLLSYCELWQKQRLRRGCFGQVVLGRLAAYLEFTALTPATRDLHSGLKNS